MEFIKVIGDMTTVDVFFKRMIGIPTDDQVYVAMLIARRKYGGGISRAEETLNTCILKDNTHEGMIRKIRRFEVPIECYVDREKGTPIPQENYATYIHLRTKSMANALVDFNVDVMKEMLEITKDKNRISRLRGVDRWMFSKICKSSVGPKFTIVDVDEKLLYPKVISLLKYYKIPIRWITETRGGYHIIIPSGNHLETFHKIIKPVITKEFVKVEILNEPITPICGTYQGGFLTQPVDMDLWKV
jgi:hypothetical protein